MALASLFGNSIGKTITKTIKYNFEIETYTQNTHRMCKRCRFHCIIRNRKCVVFSVWTVLFINMVFLFYCNCTYYMQQEQELSEIDLSEKK